MENTTYSNMEKIKEETPGLATLTVASLEKTAKNEVRDR